MENSKVYFTNMRTTFDENLPKKLERLMKAAGIEAIDFKGKYVALKIHFGEPGNLAYLRPNYSKSVADFVKAHGGKPFLTDCNTLYVGGRKNALDHLEAAYENGYSPFSTGCHVLIADGLKGTDEALVPVEGGEFVHEAKIGRAIMDADVVLTLNHFKVHEATGIGGAIKNIGMGCGSRAGKMEMHSSGKPFVQTELCISCGACRKNCAHNAISFQDKKANIDHSRCAGCGRCIGVCPADAVCAPNDEANDILCKKMAEYAVAVVKGRPQFHISFVVDVSPYCDCHAENDAPIVPNIGMFASADPVALDMACSEAVLKQPILEGSLLDEKRNVNDDYFCALHPTTNWRVTLTHAEKLGLGNTAYTLVEI